MNFSKLQTLELQNKHANFKELQNKLQNELQNILAAKIKYEINCKDTVKSILSVCYVKIL
jgi:predicted nucleic acid-binding OB-fold protein